MKQFLAAAALALAGIAHGAPALAQGATLCGMNGTGPATGEPIVIGAIVSQTGPDDFSTSAKAARAYFDCVNQKGGIKGRPIRYLVGDDQWNPEMAAQLGAKLVNDEKAVIMAGNSSFVECAANSKLYKDRGVIVVAGVGVPRECFTASNYAPSNTGPRISAIAAAEFAGASLSAKSFVCIGPNIPNVGAWTCEGVKQWADSKGFSAKTILIDPASLDAASLVLQATTGNPQAIILALPKGLMLPILTAAEEQGLHTRTNFLSAASGYDVGVPNALGKAWDGKFYVNMEFNPLNSGMADNRNWLSVMNAYAAPSVPRDTFAQAGYLAARIVTEALLTLDPAKIDRQSAAAAIENVKAFKSDILCRNWYFGKGAARQNANHATRMAVVSGGAWATVSQCQDSGDPELEDIVAYEKRANIVR